METAGKLVDNDELRDALKENGIGRPSTRAAIIETLFKRHYIRKERKNLIATPTGVELIQLIREELLKSAELTGIWEKKLREIERRNYDAATFLSELKQMVTDIVYTVLRDNSNRRVTVMPEEPKAPAAKPAAREKKTEKKTTARKKKDAPSPAPANSLPEGDAIVGQPCPLCGKGTILKGKNCLRMFGMEERMHLPQTVRSGSRIPGLNFKNGWKQLSVTCGHSILCPTKRSRS